MNLYLFNATDSAATYGIGTYLNALTCAMEGIGGIHVYIVHLHSVRPEFEIVKENYVEFWHVPEVYRKSTFSGDVQKLEDYYRNVIYFLRLHIRDTTDLVFHFNYNQSQFLAKELKAVFDCKTVATVHFMKWALELNGNRLRLQVIRKKPENQRSVFEQLLDATDEYESLLYKDVDRVITLSLYTKTLFCSEYQLSPEKVTVIPNGLEDANPPMGTDRDALRKKWNLSERERLILFAGRLHSGKGLLFLIRAFRKVLDTNPDCRLMVAGEGNYKIYLQEAKGICTKITFTGLLGKRDLYELYGLADIGVMPSFSEQCSYVAIEMMMHGLPTVTTSACGLAEMTEDGISSLQVPIIESPDKVEIDTDLLAEKILYLLEHPDKAKEIGQNGQKRYLTKYTSEVFRKNMLDFYLSLFE